jgi:hypothetical protein
MLESHKIVHCIPFQVEMDICLPFPHSCLTLAHPLKCTDTSYLEYFNEKINSKNKFVKLAPLLFKENALYSKSEYFLNLGTSTLDLQYRINGINHVVVSQG